MAEITITQGEAITLTLRAKVRGAYVDLTGATLETRIPKNTSSDVAIPNGQHALANQGTHPGKFTVQILTTDSAQFRAGQYLNIITKVTQGSDVYYVHGRGVLEVRSPNAYV